MLEQQKKYGFGFGSFALAGLLILIVFYTGCSSDNTKKSDTLISGKTTILADEAYKPILEDMKFLYEIRYPLSNLNIVYTGEDSAYNALISDSASMSVISFEPTDEHAKYFREKGFPLMVCPIAYDAIAVAVNKNCPLQHLGRQQLHDLLTGKIANWEQVTENNALTGPVLIGFNRQGSGIINYFKKQYLGAGEQFSPRCGTFKNTLALLDSIRIHPNLIGFIPFNYLSDKDDSLTQSIKQHFKIISLESARDSSQFVLPSQSSIADSAYPLRRRVLVVNHEGKSGLGTGFVIFIASHQGQRAVLKSGLVPATMPGRLVRIIKKNI